MESTRLVIAALLLLLITSTLDSSTAARVLGTDPTQHAQAAISASLASARNVSATVSALAKSGGLKPREAAAVNDCMVTVSDSVDELRRSLQALRSNAGGSKSSSGLMGDRMENVQTWVSAALTDETTCMDGFDDGAMDGEVKRAVRGQIVKVAQLISDALALLSDIISKH